MPDPVFSTTSIVAHKANSRYAGNPITETLTNGFFTVNKQWTVQYWNKAAEKILGVYAGDIVGSNLWDKFAGVLPLEFYGVYQKAFHQKLPVHFEEYWGEMGAWFDVVTYYSDDTLSVSFKSSNHPHAEYPANPVERLKTLTELYRFVTEITNDALWEWNLATREIFWIDGGHKRLFGYQVENALIPQSFWENCIHSSDRSRVLGKLQQLLKKAGSNLWEDEYRFEKADGSFANVCDRAHIIYEDGVATRMIGATQDITARVMLVKELNDTRFDKQRADTDAIITASEKSRADIGSQLHDNFGQVLAAINIYLQLGRKNRPENIYLEKCSEQLHSLTTEVKKLYHSLLVPDKILGLVESITMLVEDASREHNLQIEFFSPAINARLIDEKMQLMIYRIVQEQLQNILQHASASHVGIYLAVSDYVLEMNITDNGKGWIQTSNRKGLGITNIITCVEMQQGSCSIISRPQEGFTLRIFLPLGDDAGCDQCPRS